MGRTPLNLIAARWVVGAAWLAGGSTAALLTACESGPPAGPVEAPIVGRLDGQPLHRAAFVDALVRAHGDAYFKRCVRLQLVEREAQRLNVTVSPDAVEAAIDKEERETLERRFNGRAKAFARQLEDYGLDRTTWRRSQAQRLRSELLVDEILKVEGAEARAKELFEGRYGPGGVDRKVRHILFSTDPATSQAYTRAEYERDKPLVLAAARQTAADVRASLLAGEALDAQAKAHSDDFSASRGGALDVNWSGRFGQAFDDAVARLKVGDVSPVIEGRRGLHVARVDGVRRGARYVGAYILVTTSPSGPQDTRDEPTRVAAARQKAARLAGLIRSGSDFARLAREQSDDPATASKGGALGPFGPGRLGPAVDRVLETMEVGAVSDPVETPNGVVLVMLAEREWRPDEDRKRVSHVFISTEYARVKARRLDGRLEALAREHAERVGGTARQPDADFGALAKAHSEDMATRNAGGRIARYRPGQMGEAVDAAIARMNTPGDVEVVRGTRGWHVVRLDGLSRADFAKVRDKLLSEVRTTPPRAEDREAYLREMERAAQVEKLF